MRRNTNFDRNTLFPEISVHLYSVVLQVFSSWYLGCVIFGWFGSESHRSMHIKEADETTLVTDSSASLMHCGRSDLESLILIQRRNPFNQNFRVWGSKISWSQMDRDRSERSRSIPLAKRVSRSFKSKDVGSLLLVLKSWMTISTVISMTLCELLHS